MDVAHKTNNLSTMNDFFYLCSLQGPADLKCTEHGFGAGLPSCKPDITSSPPCSLVGGRPYIHYLFLSPPISLPFLFCFVVCSFPWCFVHAVPISMPPQAMCALLQCGPVFDPDGLSTDGYVYTWLQTVLNSPKEKVTTSISSATCRLSVVFGMLRLQG